MRVFSTSITKQFLEVIQQSRKKKLENIFGEKPPLEVGGESIVNKDLRHFLPRNAGI